MELSALVECTRGVGQAYSALCKPLCRSLQMSQTALDILLFLGKFPQYDTACDVVRIRGIKANLVSVNVEKLVQEGYLLREADPQDRRKVRLRCTPKAEPIVAQGRAIQGQFLRTLFAGVSQEDATAFHTVMQTVIANAQRMMKELDES